MARKSKTSPVDQANTKLVVEYTIRYGKNRELAPTFPRLVVGMQELSGWPVRVAGGGSNIAHFSTSELAQAAIVAAERALKLEV